MRIERYIPSESLQPFIKSFTIIESDNGVVNNILPDTSFVLALRFKGSVSYTDDQSNGLFPRSVLTGIRKRNRIVNYSKSAANLLVIFRETGAAAFFNQPLHQLSGATVSLDSFFPASQVAVLEEQLSEGKNNRQRVAVTECFLLSHQQSFLPDQLIQSAIQQIKSAKGNIRIYDLAKALYISQDPFEKRFRRITGSSPKQFARIVRLKHLIQSYPYQENLTDAAHTAGYFDQAHFIKDFRSFTGQTPLAYFQTAPRW